MNEHLVSKIINLRVEKLGNSRTKAGPMSESIASPKAPTLVGLTCVPRLDLDHFESQSDSPRLNQRLPGINTARYLLASVLLLLATTSFADDFPPPPDASVTRVADSVTSMGMNLNIRRFRTSWSMQQVQDFYRNLWPEELSEVIMPPWTMIGTIDDGKYYNVQMQSSGDTTWGYLSISDLPEKIANKTLKLPSGKNFPKMSGSKVIDNQISNDPGKKGRTILLTNNFSVKSNHDYYQSHYRNKGWRIIMDEMTEPRNKSYAMYMTRGSDSVTLTINQVDGKTMVVGNEVKRGLLR